MHFGISSAGALLSFLFSSLLAKFFEILVYLISYKRVSLVLLSSKLSSPAFLCRALVGVSFGSPKTAFKPLFWATWSPTNGFLP